MLSDVQTNPELEIAHVLFIDIVGFSARPIDEQATMVAELNHIVRETCHCRSAEVAGHLIRMPTGDGMALVFSNSPEAPVQCALEICEALRSYPHIHLRMGIHSGPVNAVRDVNDRPNIAGGGINIARRIMDCADAGHILLSKRVAEDLSQYGHWQQRLHDLGKIEVKHGAVISLFNLYGEGFGNPTMPAQMRRHRRRSRHRVALGACAAMILALGVGGWLFYRSSARNRDAPEFADAKSIAVLPFDNFSDDKQNSYFADGIQDDILTALSKVSDLKVISRASVMRYRNNRDLPQIARELKVRHVLEGSVRRAGDDVRVNAQLIDLRDNAQLWAEQYSRKTSDLFAIQSEVAENIVRHLRSSLSAREKAALTERPTNDLEAYDLFLQARELIRTFNDAPDAKETLLRAVRLLDEAISRDGTFALAFCWSAIAHDNLYWFNYDRTPARLELAKSCVRQALQLAPDLGEAHLAQALVAYHGSRDYAKAREHLAIAARALPNSAEVCSLTGYIDRREGKWNDSLRNLTRAAELDPRNFKVLSDLSVLYDLMRRYDDKEKLFDRAIAVNPTKSDYWRLLRAETEMEKGNLARAHQLFAELPPQYDPDGSATAARVMLALYERNPGAARQVLDACNREQLVDMTGSLLPRSFFDAQIARAGKNQPRATAALSAARAEITNNLREDPENALLCAVLSVVEAGLGRRDESLAHSQQAALLRPISKDAVDGPVVLTRSAMAFAWLGDNDVAMERLTSVATIPGGPDYGQLRFDPAWDPLRGDAQFEKIVASLAPK
ncbi:MAG: hypothetical protein JO354_10605 [Verrucomicrobia bacterium]|nr:hypothetical protein [Verrucomicrobiota bacterium]